jgi:hypothetical protein
MASTNGGCCVAPFATVRDARAGCRSDLIISLRKKKIQKIRERKNSFFVLHARDRFLHHCRKGKKNIDHEQEPEGS